MATTKFIQHDSIKTLKKKQRSKTHKDIRDRINVIIMIIKGYRYAEIADNLGISLQWVKQLAICYGGQGFEGLLRKPRGGSEGFLTEDQMIQLYSIIFEGPPEKELLSRYRISDLIEIVEKRWGVKYSVGGMHGLLKRMKLSHVTYRPQNPKNDPETMKVWKKKPKPLSQKKGRSTKA